MVNWVCSLVGENALRVSQKISRYHTGKFWEQTVSYYRNKQLISYQNFPKISIQNFEKFQPQTVPKRTQQVAKRRCQLRLVYETGNTFLPVFYLLPVSPLIDCTLCPCCRGVPSSKANWPLKRTKKECQAKEWQIISLD